MAEPQARKLDLEVKDDDGAREIPSLADAPAAVLEKGSLDPVYEAKARVLNKAIQDIGMSRYQWQVCTPFLIAQLFAQQRIVWCRHC